MGLASLFGRALPPGTAARCRAQQSAASSAVEKKPRVMTFVPTIISALKGLRMPRL